MPSDPRQLLMMTVITHHPEKYWLVDTETRQVWMGTDKGTWTLDTSDALTVGTTKPPLFCIDCGRLDCQNRRHGGKMRENCNHDHADVLRADATTKTYECADCGTTWREDR